MTFRHSLGRDERLLCLLETNFSTPSTMKGWVHRRIFFFVMVFSGFNRFLIKTLLRSASRIRTVDEASAVHPMNVTNSERKRDYDGLFFLVFPMFF